MLCTRLQCGCILCRRSQTTRSSLSSRTPRWALPPAAQERIRRVYHVAAAQPDRNAAVLQKVTSGSQYGAGAVAFEFAQVWVQQLSSYGAACWQPAPGHVLLGSRQGAVNCGTVKTHPQPREFFPRGRCGLVSVVPLAPKSPGSISIYSPFLHQVGKDTEAQAFLGKLDTDREVGGMVDATVSRTGCRAGCIYAYKCA